MWNNKENKENFFSTVSENGKLDIVPKRGANDIENADFNDGRGNANPLQGKLINEKYQQLAKISFSVNFALGAANYLGTAWLFDYQIPNNITQNENGNSFNDQNYPTKWYLATNTHVMDDLKTLNSPYKETNTSKKASASTTSVKFKRIREPKLNYNYNKSSFSNPDYDQYIIRMYDLVSDKPYLDPPVTPIFLGFDYLKSSPSDFINNVPQPNSIPDDVEFEKTEEMADFSVFEIDFEKIKDIPSEFNNDPHLYAKAFTSNYANWPNKDKFKPAPNSLLNDINKFKNGKFYSLGFPQEYALGGPNNDRNSEHVALYINRPNNLSQDEYKTSGSKMVLEKHYNTFKNVPGIFDSMIGSPYFGYKSQPISNVTISEGIIPWVFQGLLYVDQNGDMQGGSSGSIFVDENNYIYGIHFASDFTAHVGINFALKCEGNNYKNNYGNYNLQPYDLVYGGYENQKSSYKDMMIKKYGNKIKTNLIN